MKLTAVALFIVLWSALPSTYLAHAHAPLESSVPAAGEHMTAMPAQMELVFGGPVREAEVLLTSNGRGNWAQKVKSTEGTTVSIPVVAGAPDGRYEIRWAATSEDGAALSGKVHFSVGDALESTSIWERTLTQNDARWIAVVTFAGIGLTLVGIVRGLITVYGSPFTQRADAANLTDSSGSAQLRDDR